MKLHIWEVAAWENACAKLNEINSSKTKQNKYSFNLLNLRQKRVKLLFLSLKGL